MKRGHHLSREEKDAMLKKVLLFSDDTTACRALGVPRTTLWRWRQDATWGVTPHSSGDTDSDKAGVEAINEVFRTVHPERILKEVRVLHRFYKNQLRVYLRLFRKFGFEKEVHELKSEFWRMDREKAAQQGGKG